MRSIAQISVAIATLDRPSGLVRCLDELLSGDVLPAEIIIVDQGQEHITRPVVSPYQQKGVRIVYVHQDRRGLSASRNCAISYACCPVIAFTDDDCVPDKTWIAELDAAFAGPSSPDVVTGRVLPLGPEQPGLYAVSLRENPHRSEFRGKALPWLIGSGGNCAIRQEWCQRVGGYDLRLGTGSPGKAAEDMEFFYRLLRLGAHIRYEPRVVIYHERQELKRRIASRFTYGYGLGAFVGMWLRRRDPYTVYIFARWLFGQGRQAIKAAMRRDWVELRSRYTGVRGGVAGVVYGIKV